MTGRSAAWKVGLSAVGLAAASVVASAQALPGAENQRTTPHLQLAWHASPATLTPGRPATVVVEVTPAAGMRVYAPGQLEYTAVSVTFAPAPPATFGDAKLPRPVEHVLVPTGERSLVYDRPFRIEVPVTVTRPRKGAPALPASLSLKGTFVYQACDDAVCYKPVRVPISLALPVS
jgi:hypothetical protein